MEAFAQWRHQAGTRGSEDEKGGAWLSGLPVFRDVHHLSTFTVSCGRWSGHPRGGKTAVLAGWEAGCMPMGEPLVRELVSPVSGGAQCSGHKRQWGRRAGEQHDCTCRGGGVEARSGQQGAALGGLMIPPGCLGEDRQNSRGSSPSATPGCPQPLEHGPNLGGPCAPAGGTCLEMEGRQHTPP